MDKELYLSNFDELSCTDLHLINGGVWSQAAAILAAIGATAVTCWNMGRDFLRDVRNKFWR